MIWSDLIWSIWSIWSVRRVHSCQVSWPIIAHSERRLYRENVQTHWQVSGRYRCSETKKNSEHRCLPFSPPVQWHSSDTAVAQCISGALGVLLSRTARCKPTSSDNAEPSARQKWRHAYIGLYRGRGDETCNHGLSTMSLGGKAPTRYWYFIQWYNKTSLGSKSEDWKVKVKTENTHKTESDRIRQNQTE